MKIYLLLLFVIIYVNMCQVIPVYKKHKEESSTEKALFTKEKVPPKSFKKVEKPTKPSKPLPKTSKKGLPKTPITVPAVDTDKTMSKEEFFAKVFGKKKERTAVKDLIVPLIVNKKFGRNTRLSIIDGKHYIKTVDLKAALMHFLSQRMLLKIFDQNNIVEDAIAVESLRQYHIDSFFSEKEVAVYIAIPPHIKIPTKLRFSSSQKVMDQEFDKVLKRAPDNISGASNFYMRESFNNEQGSASLQRNCAQLRNKTFVNYHDYIFNTGFVFSQQFAQDAATQPDHFNRDYTYVSRDFPLSNQRFKVGDIALLGLDQMGKANILGASLIKHYDITRRMQKSIRVTDKEIYLDNESQLEIFVNERLIRTITLQPGIHLLSDFPLISGLNHVKIKITDIFGAHEEINFDDFHYYELLKEGISTFGISAGVISGKSADNKIEYEQEQKVFSANYNYGITKNLTFNNGFQIHPDLYAYESELYWGSRFGLISGFGVVSRAKDYGVGTKHGLLYKNIIQKSSLSLRYESIDSDYKSLDTNLTSDLAAKALSAQASTTLSNGSLLSFNYNEREGFSSHTKSYGLSYTHYFSKDWNLKVDLQNADINGDESQNFMFTLQYKPTRTRLNYQAMLEEERRNSGSVTNSRVDIGMIKEGRFGLDGAYIYEQLGDTATQDTIRARYLHHRFTLNADYTETDPSTGGKNMSGSLSAATAIAFVGDHATMTQPISNSFILVENDDYFKERPMGIKSYNADNPVHSFTIPMTDYGLRELSVEDRDLIFGVDLKQNTFEVASKYKSGVLVEIAPKFILSVKGLVQDETGEAVGMKVFKVHTVDENGTKKALEENAIFFTNKEGKFVISDMDEGLYYAEEINSEHPRSFSFSTKNQPKQEGMIDLGVIKAEVALAKEEEIAVVHTVEKRGADRDHTLKEVSNESEARYPMLSIESDAALITFKKGYQKFSKCMGMPDRNSCHSEEKSQEAIALLALNDKKAHLHRQAVMAAESKAYCCLDDP